MGGVSTPSWGVSLPEMFSHPLLRASTAVAHEHSPPPAGVSHLVWSYFVWILAFVIFHVSMDVLRPV